MGDVHVDHAAVADDADLLAGVGVDDPLDAAHDGGLERGAVDLEILEPVLGHGQIALVARGPQLLEGDVADRLAVELGQFVVDLDLEPVSDGDGLGRLGARRIGLAQIASSRSPASHAAAQRGLPVPAFVQRRVGRARSILDAYRLGVADEQQVH